MKIIHTIMGMLIITIGLALISTTMNAFGRNIMVNVYGTFLCLLGSAI
ncbi:hypothetical protein [Lysinibacillus sp. ZYM-1]|nr:hypothetical protein [Lysinibacillus sp. ZYM-1]